MKAIRRYGAQAVLGRTLGMGEIRNMEYIEIQLQIAKAKVQNGN